MAGLIIPFFRAVVLIALVLIAVVFIAMVQSGSAQESTGPAQTAQDQVLQNDASPDLLTPSLPSPQDGQAADSADDPDGGPNEDPVWAYFLGKTGFVFYRDMADLLIQHFDLSHPGDTATARDQLAALLLVSAEGDQYNGIPLMQAVLGWFNSWHLAMQEDQAAQQQAPSGGKDADEDETGTDSATGTAWAIGSLNPAQMATIACVIYGSDPARWRRVVDEGLLAPAQAGDCAAGFADLRQSWARSLAKADIAVVSLASAQPAGISSTQELHPLTLQYRSSADPTLRDIAAWIRNSALFDGLVRHLNETVKLPDPLVITLESCGPLPTASPDAAPEMIDASGGNLQLCYEVLSDIYGEASTQNVEAPPE
ncbi:DUF4344 domain-containing metallopeptidase [Dongia soli]|uniref:DUF4344 domain-containing metallopeptidase n=1 Tax=Dongia soli TaxID=600628 RepID=A0ABU5E7U9_9PROT|nr:DUF4344 domain-containing metallopeptidase [Dongia soli]MDY0882415.1 DUF4344 domain-containing metallopeptidase [Dongia soli]